MASNGTAGTATASQPNLHFPLQEGEQVLEICRRHWIQLWPKIILYFLIGIVPPIIVAWLLDAAGQYDSDETATRVVWLISFVWFGFWAIRALLAWYQYNNDMWVITNQRIVDSYKSTPFNLKLSTADLVNIQDMSINRSGVLRTALDYGDIVCKTASTGAEFTLSAIPDPRRVQAMVDRERDRERRGGR